MFRPVRLEISSKTNHQNANTMKKEEMEDLMKLVNQFGDSCRIGQINLGNGVYVVYEVNLRLLLYQTI